MKHLLTIIRAGWVALCLVTLCMTLYGCKDSASVSDRPDVPLASLSITPATLQPAFSSDTTNYTAEAPTAATSITVTATPQDSTVTVSIDGTVTTQRSFDLKQPGSTKTIPIVLTTPTGLESTYAVNVTRLLSGDNNLKTLTVTPGPLNPPFAAETIAYTVNVAADVSRITVTATKSDPSAVVSGDIPNEGQQTIQLDGPGTSKTVSINVTAPDQSLKSYTVIVKRAASSNNNLSGLSITPGPLEPAFAPNTLSYTVNVALSVSAVVISATKQDPNAVISGSVPNEGLATIPLDGPGTSKVVLITVTAQDATTSKTYSVTVKRAASSNTNLSALTVTPSSLRPGFVTGTLIYTVDVATDVRSIQVSATKDDPNAVLSGSILDPGLGQAVGQATIPLDGPGTSKVVLITVTAQDATTSKTYSVTVKRAASSNNNLSTLNITPGALDPVFAANTLGYTVNVAHTVSAVVISATKEDPNAVISGSVPNEGLATIPLDGPGTNKVVLITVTAQDATTSKTYSITINRRASPDSTLSALSVSAGALDPPFASNIVDYTVQVGLLVGSVTITATKTDPNATMSSLGSVIAAAGTPIGHVTVSPALGAGTMVDLTMIAQDGINSTTYRITVTRGLF